MQFVHVGRRSLPVVALAFASALPAQAPPTYYQTVDTTNAATLRATLHAIIDDHQRFPYTSTATDTWNVLEAADENPANAGAILDLYKNASYAKAGGGTGPYDREHSWPKSYGFPNDGATNYPYTDCHHLFLCDSSYNSSRGNRPYAFTAATASEKVTLLTNGKGGGVGVYPGNSNWTDALQTAGRWEAWGDRRGDCARSLMYLDVRYEGGTHGVTGAAEPNLVLTDTVNLIVASNTGSNINTAYMGMLGNLLAWHAADPVDQKERDRNDAVFSFQGNRNPFIDHPEWVDCLFAGNCGDTTPPAAPTALVATAGNAQVALDWANNSEADLAGYHVYRATASAGPFTQLTSTPLASSAYTATGLTNGTSYWFFVRALDVAGNVSAQSATVSATPTAPASGTLWINELHYDNAGTDVGEFVEIAGPAGTSLTGWKLLAYNGADGAVYATVNLSGTIANQQNGFGTRSFAVVLQNGAPDGVALVSPTNVVVEFVSYEGAMTATSGAAAGKTSTAIPTAETTSTPVGFSLQRQGTGSSGAQFTWSAPIDDTPGARNTGQTFGG